MGGAGAGAGASRSGRAGSLTSIAAAAGVSVSTVSKVLNGRTDVAPETRERLGRILRLHGYQVAPRSGIGVVDLLIGGLGGLWSDELIRGAVTAAAETEISVIVSQVASASEFARWLKIATARGTLGALSVLYLPDQATLRRMADASLPLVVIDPPAEPGGEIRSVGTTNWQGGLSVTRHLIELGHRRIAAIGGPDHLWSCRARLDGYRSALRRADLPVDEDLVRCDELTADAGLRRARELLEPGRRADRDRGRQRRPGVRRAAGHRRARAALSRRRQRDRLRRRADRHLGHAAAHHRQAAAGGDGRHRVLDAHVVRRRARNAAPPPRAGNHPRRPAQHRPAQQR